MSAKVLSFLGDVVLDKAYNVGFSMDKFIFNLEHPLSCEGTPAKNKVNLCSDGSYIEETFGSLPIAVNLANNHIADFGDKAFVKTIDFLDKNQIAYFGAGNESDNFNNPALIEFNGKRIALLGYCCESTKPVFGNKDRYGSARLDLSRISADILNAKKLSDLIVISLHWGLENFRYPEPSKVKLARMLIDNGADMILGHHAHVIQSFEKYKGKYIFYGLGHFIFPYRERPSYFDGNQFLKTYRPIARKSNRVGLVVHLKDRDEVDYETVYFDDQIVNKASATIPQWIPENQLRFHIYRTLRTKSRVIHHFLRNPRIPKVSQMRKFILGR